MKKSYEPINHFNMKASKAFAETEVHFHVQVCFLPFTSSLLVPKYEKEDDF